MAISSTVRPSSFLTKFFRFQFVSLADLIFIVLLIIEVCLPVFWFCLYQSKKRKKKKKRVTERFRWEGTSGSIQSNPLLGHEFPLLQVMAVASCAFPLHLWEKPGSVLSIPSLWVVADSNRSPISRLFSRLSKPSSFSLPSQQPRQDFPRWQLQLHTGAVYYWPKCFSHGESLI